MYTEIEVFSSNNFSFVKRSKSLFVNHCLENSHYLNRPGNSKGKSFTNSNVRSPNELKNLLWCLRLLDVYTAIDSRRR